VPERSNGAALKVAEGSRPPWVRIPAPPFAVAGTLVLLVWAISVAGATGWSHTVNWVLFGVGVGLLAVRRVL
jgi:hypothetical protein